MVRVACLETAIGFVATAAVLGGCFPTDRPVASNVSCDDSGCACLPNRGNCDGSPHNGCEADLLFDARHCGACDIQCGHGQCVDGECEAADDFVDCNESMTDGFEAHLPTDPRNCGACTRDCLGGACSDGECQPYRPVDAGYDIYGLASDETYVYFCEDFSGTILRIPQSGGTPEILAFDQPCSSQLAAAGGYVYWAVWPSDVAAPELIFEVTTEGEGLRIMETTEDLRHLVAADDVVAWIDRRDVEGVDTYHIVARVGAAATPQVLYEVASDVSYIDALAVHGGSIYWIEESWANVLPPQPPVRPRVRGIAATGGSIVELAGVEAGVISVEGLQAGDGALYWREVLEDPDQYRIARLDVGSSEPEYVRVSDWYIANLVSDEAGIFWSEADGRRLLGLPTGEEQPVLLADFLEIDQLTIGSQAFFWYDWPDKLLALAK